jgi:hypothetical protein
VPKYELAKVTFTDMEDYLQLYQKAGFNLFRWGVNNASFNLWKDENNQTDWLYSQYGDKFVQALKDQQYHIMMTIYGFFPPHAFAINNQQHQAEIKKQLDYVVARYSSYVDIWEINNEATVSQEWLEFVIDYLHEIDPYQHPITTNWDRPELQALDLQSIHWYEFVKDTTPTAANTKNAINFYKQFQKPILFSETGNTNKSWDENSATRLRLRLWSGLFNQGYFVFWNQSREMYFNPDNANIYLGPNERQFTKTFSDFTAKIDRSFQPLQLKQVDPKYEIYGLKNQKHIYLYMVKIRKEDQVQELTLPFMIENYTWFDPSTGQQLTKPLDSIQVDADQEGVVEEKITLPNFKTDLLIEVNLAATNNETNHE